MFSLVNISRGKTRDALIELAHGLSWSAYLESITYLANLALQEGDDLSRAKSCFGFAKVRQGLIAI